MSLLAWYPLNGNIKNYGILGFDADLLINNIAPSFSDGKYQYSLNEGDLNLNTRVSNKIFNHNEFTYSFWIYPIDNTGTVTDKYIIGNLNNNLYAIKQYPTCNDLLFIWKNSNNTTFFEHQFNSIIPSQKWTHVTVTYKVIENTSSIKIYLNSLLEYEETVNSVYIPNTLIDYNIIQNNSNRKLNDLRFYDHELSQYEIKEIYQNCSLNLNFNDIYSEYTKNLLSGVRIDASSLTVNIPRVGSEDCHLLIKSENLRGTYTDGTGRINLPFNILTPGKTYRFSCDYKLSENSGFRITDWCDIYLHSNVYKIIQYPDHYHYEAYFPAKQYTTTYRFIDFMINENSTCDMYNMQLQENPEFTPFINGTRESMIYDCSGLGNNLKSGKVYLSSDRKNGSYSLASTGSIYQNSSVGPYEFTYNIWFKNNNSDITSIVLFDDGRIKCYNNPDNDYILADIKLSDNTILKLCSPLQKMHLLTKEFHLLSITFDGINFNMYLDAKLHKSITTNVMPTNNLTDLKLLSEGNDVLISDFIIYTTPLSSEDIKDIILEAGAVDNKGSLYAKEIIQVDPFDNDLEQHSPEAMNVYGQSKAESFESGNEIFEIYKNSSSFLNFISINENNVLGDFHIESSNNDVVNIKSNNTNCKVQYEKSTQILTLNSSDYYTGDLIFRLPDAIPESTYIALFINYLDGITLFKQDSYIQIGGFNNITNNFISDTKYVSSPLSDISINEISDNPIEYFRIHFDGVQMNDVRLRISYGASSETLTYFIPSNLNSDSFSSDNGIIKPNQIYEK